ncbi:histidine ammonia-lyase [Neolewinella lacunae]|uniref:Histidine ammonia-lyase n=1 Tax=Neolewinella lacunae TaxID=1517758 RepID=A0A923T7W8_9BACT|nr:histidine ammonia-lyase [Neolewinella lacunae]MBC6993984.1 histidine ammonia-lyase [Neolewinella lacunae]MDN3635501.1 histidine ammonia-lyase [Neolewinella lacunae]
MFHYGSHHLTREKCLALASGRLKGELSPEAWERVRASRSSVERMAAGDKAVYGINTGFGPLCDTQITPEQTSKLQENLLLSHAVGVGEPIAPLLSKVMLICKVQALAQGYSGVRPIIIERLLYFIEHDLLPVVPEQGSVGASGDLAPLAHLFLPLLGEGEMWQNGRVVPASSVLSAHHLAPLQLAAKEGLALINGTQFILAHAVLGLDKMAYLLDLADLTGAMSLEGFQGSAAPFREDLHALRPFAGSIRVAERIRHFLEGSENMASHAACSRVQDPYSLRCMPQVHGASRNAFAHLEELVDVELNAVTDNPIILDEETAISGGNFHGQPLAMALDYCCVAAAELGNIADRRCYLLLEGRYGLPRLLTTAGGLNSGLMIPQYTTAALVTENKSLCFPASADSIPTSLGQEDHVSMGSISGRRFNQILGNLEKILAIEMLYAAQAMDFRRPLRFSEILEYNHALVRAYVPTLEEDRMLKNDIAALLRLVAQRKFRLH